MKMDLPGNLKTRTLEEVMQEIKEARLRREAWPKWRKALYAVERFPTTAKWWLEENYLNLRAFKKGFYNLWFFFRAVWQFRPWDVSWTFRLLEKALLRLEDDMRGGFILNGEKYAKDIKVARLLCRRLGEERDRYDEKTQGELSTYRTFEAEDRLRNQDLDLLGRILRKHSAKWWT